nr:hypothetical protein [uncultured Shinella sp.]
MTNTLQRFVAGGRDIRKSRFAEMKMAAAGVEPMGAWLFNRGDADDVMARRMFSRNRIIGARNAPEDRLVIGAPQVFDDYARFGPGDAILTRISEPLEWTMYAIARSTYPTMGATTNERAQIGGWFGNTANRGSSLIFQSMTALRGITYQNPTTPVLVPADLNVPTSSINKWRVYRMWGADTGIRLKNISGDSATNEPVATPIVGGKAAGRQRFAIGCRLESGVPGSYVGHCDIAGLLLFKGAIGPGAVETAIYAQLGKQIEQLAFTELSV